MPMTLADVRTEVRALLNEPTAAFWSDTEIDNWIGQAAIALSSTGCVETTATVTLAASTNEYAAPSTFANPTPADSALLFIADANLNGEGLTKVYNRSFGHINVDPTADQPRAWSHVGERVFFYPVGAGATGTVNLLCRVKSDDITDIPDPWQPHAIAYATGKALQKDRRFLEAGTLLSEFFRWVLFLRNDVLERGLDSKQAMQVPTRVERR